MKFFKKSLFEKNFFFQKQGGGINKFFNIKKFVYPHGFFLCEGQFFLDFLTNALFESPCKIGSLQIIHFNSKTRHFMVKKCRIFEKCIICSDFFQHRFAMVKKTSLSRANLTKKLRYLTQKSVKKLRFLQSPQKGGGF